MHFATGRRTQSWKLTKGDSAQIQRDVEVVGAKVKVKCRFTAWKLFRFVIASFWWVGGFG